MQKWYINIMQTIYKDIRFSSPKFWVFLFLVLMLGRGSSLVAQYDPRTNIAGTILYMLCIVSMLSWKKINWKNYNPKIAVVFWCVLTVWFLGHLFILDNGFNIMPYSIFMLHIFAGILIINTYNKSIVAYYEKAMVFLSAISIIGWGIESLGMSSMLLKSPILLENSAGVSDYSLILYTLSVDPERSQELYGGIFRNSGCAWEPGLFSIMVCIAILFNIYQYKKIIFNKRLIILLIALITTFSTTGYIVAIVIFAGYYIFSKKVSIGKRIIYISLISLVCINLYNLPFISEKIKSNADTESFSIEDGGVEWHEKEGQTFTVGRFEGIMLDYINVQDKPIMGYGLMRESSYVYKNISPVIITSNGIMKPFAQLGIILGVLIFILMYKSTVRLSKECNFTVPWLLFAVIIVGSVSYMIDSTPIIRALQLYALYIPVKLIKKQYE